MRYSPLLAVAVLFAGTPFAMCAGPEADLIFYAPFDGDTAAVVAGGKAEATCAIEPRFETGLRGQSLVIGGSPKAKQEMPGGPSPDGRRPRNSVYASEGNINLHQGTLCFWVKPLDWSGGDEDFNVLFYTHAGPNYFQIYKFFHDDRLLFLRGEQEKWTDTHYRSRDWRPGQWHHLAVTWSPEEMRMFLNGHLVCRRRVRFPLNDAASVEPFSVGPGGAWSHAFIGHSLVDEFRIYRRPLSREELQKLYLTDAAAVEHDSGLITLGERTPPQDGRIEPDTYSFDSTGLEYPTQPMVSPERSRYALSYDREFLYLATLTESSSAAGAAAPEGLDLLLSRSPSQMLTFSFFEDGSVASPSVESLRVKAVRVRNTRLDGLWLLEAAIPFRVLDMPHAPDGQTWRMNLVRHYGTRATTISLAPVAGSETNRSHFIALVFRPDAPAIRFADWTDREKRQSAQVVDVRPARQDSDIRWEGIRDTTESYGLQTRSEPLFSKGRATPYRSPVWQLGIGADFSLNEQRIVETKGGVSTTLYVRKTVSESNDPLRVFYLYTQAGKRLVVSGLGRADGGIRACFLRPDGSEAFRAEHLLPVEASYFSETFDLDFSKLTPGRYSVKIDHVAPDGKATETWRQAYLVPGPDHPAFHPYVDPEARQVPAPWTPVELTGDRSPEARGETKWCVTTWGRTYGFSGPLLLSSLVSQNEEILSAPARLRLNGQPLVPVTPMHRDEPSVSPMLVEWAQATDLGPFHADSKIKMHFDGYCEVELKLAPDDAKPAQIRSLSLDIPLQAEAATMVRDAKIAPLVGSKTGAVGDSWHQGFAGGQGGAYLWVGNDRVGLNWIAQDLENWHNKQPDRQVELIREGDTVLLRLNLIDSPWTPEAPLVYRFGFMLTPSRPLDRAVLRRREHKEFQMWCQPWRNFAVPDYDTADIATIRDALSRVAIGADEVFLYLGVDLTSPFTPEWPWFVEEWKGPQGEYGKWTGSFRDPVLRDRNTYSDGSIHVDAFFNWMQQTRATFFERAKTPLIPEAHSYYFDTGPMVIPRYREQAINVYRMIRRTGPEARIYTHQGWPRVMPYQHFTDMICGGEGVGATVSQKGNYYDLLTPEMFRATFSPYIWGMKTVFLDMSVRMLKEENPERLLSFDLNDPSFRRPLLHVYGYCVVHDVDIHDPNEQSKPLRETIWAAQDSLGWDADVVFHPYWEDDAVRRVSPNSSRVMASAYTKAGKMILAVVNDTDEEQEVELRLDLDRLGVTAGGEASDVWDPEKCYRLDARWKDTVPARGFRMILWD